MPVKFYNKSVMFVPLFACLLFLRLGEFTAAETGCPEQENVAPCSCVRLPTVRLTCSGLNTPDTLERVFARSERYTFHQVLITNSILLYIPGEIFEKVTVKELWLRNMILQSMFSDMPVENHDTEKIRIENTVVQRTITSQNFTRFASLKEIHIYNSTLPTVLIKRFGKLLPRNIKTVILRQAETKSIANGSLENIPNLDKFAVEYCSLKKLSRAIFPRPFNGRILSFSGNQISSIPEDMFQDMPDLQFVYLMNNALSVIPESAFAGRTVNVPYMRFEGNPLQCDCRLSWLIKDKPEVLGGQCDRPEKFKGRELKDLIPAELGCTE